MHPVRDSSGTFLLFVYGTLKRGGCRHGALVGQRFLGEVQTTPNYQLLNLGDYPGLVETTSVGEAIRGELYEVDCALVEWLDSMEDAPSWFDLAPVQLAGRDAPVWAYFYRKDATGRSPISGGFWKVPDKPEPSS